MLNRKLKLIGFILVLSLSYLSSCSAQDPLPNEQNQVEVNDSSVHVEPIDTSGITLQDRFIVPPNYSRRDSSSFAVFLRNLKLKPAGSLVHYFDGTVKQRSGVYCAVLDQDIGKRDLHQCADAIMNLYATFHFTHNNDSAIHFNFTNGWRCDFSKYRDGYRVSFISGTKWYKKTGYSRTEQTFRNYMTLIYSYCGTASLEKELVPVNNHQSIQPGDVFIKGGHPGHAVMVMDVVEDAKGEKLFLLAQSYMPAQQMQILINPSSIDGSPWYSLADLENNRLVTPEWTFAPAQLMRFSFK